MNLQPLEEYYIDEKTYLFGKLSISLRARDYKQFVTILKNNDKKININHVDFLNMTLLNTACNEGDLVTYNFLSMFEGVSFERVSYNGRTAIHEACFSGNLEIVKDLIEVKKVNFTKCDDYGLFPINIACLRENVKVVNYFLKEVPANVHLINSMKSMDPLRYAMSTKDLLFLSNCLSNYDINTLSESYLKLMQQCINICKNPEMFFCVIIEHYELCLKKKWYCEKFLRFMLDQYCMTEKLHDYLLIYFENYDNFIENVKKNMKFLRNKRSVH